MMQLKWFIGWVKMRSWPNAKQNLHLGYLDCHRVISILWGIHLKISISSTNVYAWERPLVVHSSKKISQLYIGSFSRSQIMTIFYITLMIFYLVGKLKPNNAAILWKFFKNPTAVLVFLGIELDTINMVMRLPQEKVSEIKERITMYIMSKQSQNHSPRITVFNRNIELCVSSHCTWTDFFAKTYRRYLQIAQTPS